MNVTLTTVVLISLTAPAAPADFPTPTDMEANVGFWLRVYSQWPTNRYAIHDDQRLDVVYQVIAATDGRSAVVKHAKAQIEQVLAKLDAKRPRSEKGLHGLELKVYRAWKGVSNPPARFASGRGHVRHQKGQRDRFASALRKSGRYRTHIEAILAKHGLPRELLALVFVESMFASHARSYSGATGIWQFMRATGREYLNINSVVDERRDPILATYAASQYLRSAHKRLQTWPLAITSYNYGMNGMARAVRAVGTRDLSRILSSYRSGRLGFAAKNYYTEFVAALRIWRNPTVFFPEVKPLPPWRYDIVRIPASTTAKALFRAGAVQKNQLDPYNPALTREALAGRVALPAGFALRLPPGHADHFEKTIRRMKSMRRRRAPRTKSYTIRSGDSLIAIARRHRIHTGQLLAANSLSRDDTIHPGMVLRIPPRSAGFTLLPGAHPLPTTRASVASAALSPAAPATTEQAPPVRYTRVSPRAHRPRTRTRPRTTTGGRVEAGPARSVEIIERIEGEIAIDVLSGAPRMPLVDMVVGCHLRAAGKPPFATQPTALLGSWPKR